MESFSTVPFQLAPFEAIMDQMTNINTSPEREEGDEALPSEMPSHPGHPELGTSSGYNLAWLDREEAHPLWNKNEERRTC